MIVMPLENNIINQDYVQCSFLNDDLFVLDTQSASVRLHRVNTLEASLAVANFNSRIPVHERFDLNSVVKMFVNDESIVFINWNLTKAFDKIFRKIGRGDIPKVNKELNVEYKHVGFDTKNNILVINPDVANFNCLIHPIGTELPADFISALKSLLPTDCFQQIQNTKSNEILIYNYLTQNTKVFTLDEKAIGCAINQNLAAAVTRSSVYFFDLQ